MKFWDSSALVPLLVEDAGSDAVREILRQDPDMIAWWGSDIECASAIARRERQGDMDAQSANDACRRLSQLRGSWIEVHPTEETREMARRLLRVHDLRAGDSLQLAAAWTAAEHRPSSLEIVSADRRLSEAALREGFAMRLLQGT